MTKQVAELVQQHSNLIYSITHHFKNNKNKEDLFQEGVIGLIKAHKNYDRSYNVKFTTYAYTYILGEMLNYIDRDKGLKINRETLRLSLKVEKTKALLTQKLMKEPTIREVAFYLELPEELIVRALNATIPIKSFDEPVENLETPNLNLYNIIPDKKKVDIDTLLTVKEEISKLGKLEKEIIQKRYFEDLTQTEIAEQLGINQVQVSRKETRAINKMKVLLK